MFRKSRIAFFVCFAVIPAFLATSCYIRPPKPGPGYVWVKPHKTPAGVHVKGHWKNLPSPRPGAVWVPGHYGPKGHWIDGHWR